ncbi:hypothetical protein SAMN04489712_1276 [Thermomonospora echinospora]|uniref:Uncharacterized protein n=1 Tax=Thermomonospora echinospora TaxID=1992 RepID=A0A1H6DZA8_9ACTN|nr:HGxxPAAW family protein [Thermomonospora echinospora]SEG90677.1 hypothetical protein SAMN04489712_1276 [Thermomonospora echinospora]
MSGSGSHGGRPSSWLVFTISMTGFIVGGVALCIGPNWMMFWAGVVIVAVSGVLGLAVGIMSDVVLDKPRVARDALADPSSGS